MTEKKVFSREFLEEIANRYQIRGISRDVFLDALEKGRDDERIINGLFSTESAVRQAWTRIFTAFGIKNDDSRNTRSYTKLLEILISEWTQYLQRNPPVPDGSIDRIHDLKSAPEVLNPFYGRIKELNTLKTWILEDTSRLITIYGITGIGKTCFVRHLVERIKNEFQGVIWRSLKTPPPDQPPTLTKFLQDILKSLNQQFARESSLTLDSNVRILIDQLINDLDRHRCLLILDDFEFILQDEATAGTYKEGYDGYGDLLEEIAKKSHKSCLLINSWEQPQGLTSWSEYPCKSYELLGLGDAAEELLKSEGLKEPENYQKLIDIYRGNPLVLKSMATSIKELFQGSIAKYLAKDTLVNPSEYCNKFAKMLKRLSLIEKDILRALSSQNQELNFDTLGEKVNELAQEDGRSSYRCSSFLEALESLNKRSLIESIKRNDNLTYRTVQPLIRRYFQT
jgi:hypothetical protein